MTPEQKAAYVYSQAVAAQAAIEGMKIENAARAMNGYAPAYPEPEFAKVITEFGLDHNTIMALFHDD